MATTRGALADPALWEAPPADGFDRLLGTIRAGAPQNDAGPRRLWLVAAAVVLLTGVATAIPVLRPNDDADWQIALAATTAHPDAMASVQGWNTDTGTRIRITIEGIDDLANDGFYELWMTSPDGEDVSAGTFRSTGTIDAWSAVRRADFPRLWITRESFDGDPSPSGDTVVDTPT
ncbi:MAG: anti-sigma factor [Ilumatobacter sp.]